MNEKISLPVVGDCSAAVQCEFLPDQRLVAPQRGLEADCIGKHSSSSLSYIENNSSGSSVVRPWCEEEQPKAPTPYQHKSIAALEHNVQELVRQHGIDNFVVLTLTFKDNVQDSKEVSRRLNCAKRLLDKLFVQRIVVKERHLSGRWHLHLLCLCQGDVGSSFDVRSCQEARRLDPDLLLHQFEPRSGRMKPGMRMAGTGRERSRALMQAITAKFGWI